MTAQQNNLDTAVSLMRMALGLLDRDSRALGAACHLQAAIDDATGAKPLQPGEEIDPELLAAFEARLERQRERNRREA